MTKTFFSVLDRGQGTGNAGAVRRTEGWPVAMQSDQ